VLKLRRGTVYIRRKAGGHLEVIFKYKFGVQEWRMVGNVNTEGGASVCKHW